MLRSAARSWLTSWSSGATAGVTTALRLQREGVRVVLLEAVAIGSGVSGNTSAKVSALQRTTLSTIVSRHGTEAGEVYAAASASAVEDVAELAEEEKVDCGLDRRPAVTYAASPEELKAVADERDPASGAGLPVQWREDDAGQPYPVSGAIWLRDQIGLQPVDYVRGLARAFERAGGQICESTRVLLVEAGSPCEVRTRHGVVRAGQVVIATHYPILDRGLFFARLRPSVRTASWPRSAGRRRRRWRSTPAAPPARSSSWAAPSLSAARATPPAPPG